MLTLPRAVANILPPGARKDEGRIVPLSRGASTELSEDRAREMPLNQRRSQFEEAPSPDEIEGGTP
jgi:hypothetical protein